MMLSKVAVAAESRFTFSELTAKDKRTGLVWTKNGNMGDLKWDNTSVLLNKLNSDKYGGYNNWRLPSRKELLVLVDYSYSIGDDPPSPTTSYSAHPYVIFNKIGFYNVSCGQYWSGTSKFVRTINYRTENNKTTPFRHYTVWAANMCNGDVTGEWPRGSHTFYVWPVSSGK